VADDVSPNTRVECPKVPTELGLREPPIDSCGRFVHSTDAAGNTLGGICHSMVERFPLPRLRFTKSFGYLNFELLKCMVIYIVSYLNFELFRFLVKFLDVNRSR
jgi:hypothetical protein